MTLTAHYIKGPDGSLRRNHSSHAVLERGPHVSKTFADHTQKLLDKYYPLEQDQNLPHDQKLGHMIDWWTQAHTAILAEQITRQIIRDQAQATDLAFREHITSFVDLLADRQIPLLIFSAGLGDVIEQLMDVHALGRPNQTVVSNRMIFNGDDPSSTAVDFREPLIHSLNKGEVALSGDVRNEDSFNLHDILCNRRNVIVIGDSPGDARMADGGIAHDTLLKIGLLNFDDDSHKRRDDFLNLFDIVIEGDTSLESVTSLLRWIAD
ncbi:hypothetical protein PYCC9005_002167 [Savitreella phatthalungensis]